MSQGNDNYFYSQMYIVRAGYINSGTRAKLKQGATVKTAGKMLLEILKYKAFFPLVQSFQFVIMLKIFSCTFGHAGFFCCDAWTFSSCRAGDML